MELSRSSSRAQLAAYLEASHELLAGLLPADTSCNDLFSEVETGGSPGEFFNASDDPTVGRELKRLGHKIGGWLVEEKAHTKAQQKRDKRAAAAKALRERKKPKVLVFGEPLKPPTMAFADAQVVAAEAAAKRTDGARERLLEKGWTGKFRVPGAAAPSHQQWFMLNPSAACNALGLVYKDTAFGQYVVYFPGAALLEFEKIKRATKTKVSGKGVLKVVTPVPYANWTLPTFGDALTWQEFFSFVGYGYNATDAATTAMILKNTPAKIEEMGEKIVREMGTKYDIKIERQSKEIAKVDQRVAEAREQRVKAELEEQLRVLRATRDALIDERVREVEKMQRQYDGYKETKMIMEAQAKAKTEKADQGMAKHFARKAAAGEATFVDGAAALAAIATGKSVADQAAAELTARAMAVVLTDIAQLQVWRAEDAMEVERVELAADFADF